MKNPHIVFFYMNGCPHCERTRPLWDEVKKDIPPGIAVLEVEAMELSPEDQSRVQGFPRIERTSENGTIVVTIEGAPANAEELRKKLKVSRRRGASRRRTLRKRNTRRRKF